MRHERISSLETPSSSRSTAPTMPAGVKRRLTAVTPSPTQRALLQCQPPSLIDAEATTLKRIEFYEETTQSTRRNSSTSSCVAKADKTCPFPSGGAWSFASDANAGGDYGMGEESSFVHDPELHQCSASTPRLADKEQSDHVSNHGRSIVASFIVDVQENGGTEVSLGSPEQQDYQGNMFIPVTSCQSGDTPHMSNHTIDARKMTPEKTKGSPVSFCGLHSTFQDAAGGVSDMMRRECADRTDLDKHEVTSPKGTKNIPETTRSAPPHRPDASSPIGSKMLCGPRCLRSTAASDTAVTVHQQKTIEQTICGFLGSHGTWWDGWQAWSIHMTAGQSALGNPSDLQAMRRILRNRAGDMNARSRRISRLRGDLSPFDEDDGLNHISGLFDLRLSVEEVQRANSFSPEYSQPGRISPQSQSATSTTDEPESVVSMSSSVFFCERAATEVITRETSHLPKGEIEDLCYDSDPGEASNRRLGRLRRPKERSGKKHRHQSVQDFLRHGTWKDNVNNESIGQNHADFDFNDEYLVHKLIEETIHRRLTLVWHCTGGKRDSPVAVKAWVELGSQLRSALIQPKFVWKPIQEEDGSNNEGLGLTAYNLHSIDLLDINRIFPAQRIDRKLHPLAKRRCSFTIASFDQTHLFETSCEEERDRFADGLKMLVARLGSKIIMRDDKVFEEFFNPFGTVPGEAPAWALSDEEV